MLYVLLYYGIIIIILMLVIFFIYVRLKYRFWAIQPVYHFYDVHFWFKNKGVIRETLPEKNRYTQTKTIKTRKFSDISEIKLNEIVRLLQLNYLRDGDNHFRPMTQNVAPYFVSHSAPAFISTFYTTKRLQVGTSTETIETQRLAGVITSRPLRVKFVRKGAEMEVYYVDYLCIDKNERKKGIAQQLIQTHEYNQSHLNHEIGVSLFKREEELTSIVPLCAYKVYCFDTKAWIIEPEMLSKRYALVKTDRQNVVYLRNFMVETEKLWDITVTTNISNLMELIETQNVYVYFVMRDEEIQSAYFFRKTCTNLDKYGEILSCFASIKSNELTTPDFVTGFKMALWKILTENTNYMYLCIEDISSNNHIIKNLKQKTPPMIVSTYAYFFYNFAHSPFLSNKVLIIN